MSEEYILTPSCNFFLESGKGGCWNLPLCVEIKEPFNADMMKSVLKRVIAENDTLRCIVFGRNADGIYTVRFEDEVTGRT